MGKRLYPPSLYCTSIAPALSPVPMSIRHGPHTLEHRTTCSCRGETLVVRQLAALIPPLSTLRSRLFQGGSSPKRTTKTSAILPVLISQKTSPSVFTLKLVEKSILTPILMVSILTLTELSFVSFPVFRVHSSVLAVLCGQRYVQCERAHVQPGASILEPINVWLSRVKYPVRCAVKNSR